MYAIDFRINNLVDLGNRIAKIIEIGVNYCVVSDLEETQDTIESYDRIKPIILDKEWLLMFGFYLTFIPNNCIYVKNSFEICGGNANKVYDCLGFNIKYVHQLQNLYFSLTGNELNVQ